MPHIINWADDGFGNYVALPFKMVMVVLNHCYPECEDEI